MLQKFKEASVAKKIAIIGQLVVLILAVTLAITYRTKTFISGVVWLPDGEHRLFNPIDEQGNYILHSPEVPLAGVVSSFDFMASNLERYKKILAQADEYQIVANQDGTVQYFAQANGFIYYWVNNYLPETIRPFPNKVLSSKDNRFTFWKTEPPWSIFLISCGLLLFFSIIYWFVFVNLCVLVKWATE